MKIDIHGHFTNAPAVLDAFRGRQLGYRNKPQRRKLNVTDDQIVSALGKNLEAMDERGIDMVIFSPRASGMNHDLGGAEMSLYWAEVNNDLIARVCTLVPDRFAPVCQLPQSPGTSPTTWLGELERCVNDLGFIGCNINPDISGGLQPFTPSLADEYWYPLWEKMVELDVPGMIHASTTNNPAFHINGAHYIAWDYTAVVELAASKVWQEFPTLKLIIPHGGGGIPFQWNRHRALHVLQNERPFEEAVHNLYFDTSVYDSDSLEMLVRKVGADRVMFGSEMFGTALSRDPDTGRGFDDIMPFVDKLPGLTSADLDSIYYRNARNVFPRLHVRAAADRSD